MKFEQVTVFLVQYTMYIIIMQLSPTCVVSQLLFLCNVRTLSAKRFGLLRFVVLPNGSSQINPLRTPVQSRSFQRHPNPFQAESQLIAFKNDPHLPSPLGSPGPQNLFVSEIFVPSDQTQFNRPLNPRNNSRSSKVISFL